MVAGYLVKSKTGRRELPPDELRITKGALGAFRCAQLLHAPAKPLGGLVRVNTRTLEPSDRARNKDELHLARSERKVHARVWRKRAHEGRRADEDNEGAHAMD